MNPGICRCQVLSDRVPHAWLFQRCSAVIHHGGASTTAMGLRCGKPTMICPFFGDQFFWAQMVRFVGVSLLCSARVVLPRGLIYTVALSAIVFTASRARLLSFCF